MGFKVQSPKWAFRVEDENGGLIKEYQLEIGSDIFVKTFSEKAKKFAEKADAVKTDILALLPDIQEIIDPVLGEGEYAFLMSAFKNNALVMIEFVSAFVAEGNDMIKKRSQKNLERYL